MLIVFDSRLKVGIFGELGRGNEEFGMGIVVLWYLKWLLLAVANTELWRKPSIAGATHPDTIRRYYKAQVALR
jgi:hypothetical protein